MDLLALLSLVAGLVLVAAVGVDVFATTLHADNHGQGARLVQRGTWRLAVRAGRTWPTRQRSFLALAGPLMVVLTFALWLTAFVVGLALVVWPFLGDFRSEPELASLGFLDALYYAGVTATVLGYGDITPVRGVFKILAPVASGAGFALVTGAVTYVIELVSGIDERHRFALRVHDDTGGTQNGSQLVVRALSVGDVSGLRLRYEAWATAARSVQDKVHRFAAASFYYRSRNPLYDLEPALRTAAEAAIAGHLAATDPRLARLGPSVEHLDAAISRLMETIAQQYIGSDVVDALRYPDSTDAEVVIVATIDRQLRAGLADRYQPSDGTAALALAARLRVFLAALERFTGLPAEEIAHGQTAQPYDAA